MHPPLSPADWIRCDYITATPYDSSSSCDLGQPSSSISLSGKYSKQYTHGCLLPAHFVAIVDSEMSVVLPTMFRMFIVNTSEILVLQEDSSPDQGHRWSAYSFLGYRSRRLLPTKRPQNGRFNDHFIAANNHPLKRPNDRLISSRTVAGNASGRLA